MKICYHNYAKLKWKLQLIKFPCIYADYWNGDIMAYMVEESGPDMCIFTCVWSAEWSHLCEVALHRSLEMGEF
jgi:hypothetical protein